MAKKTKKPTGLAISRDGYKFTYTWTPRGDGSTAQQLNAIATKRNPPDSDKTPDSKSISVKKNTKSASETLTTLEAERNTNGNTAKYKPNGPNELKEVSFKVRGKHAGKWSGWQSKSYAIKPPTIPAYVAPQATNQNYTYSYGWNYNQYENDDHIIFVDYYWETVLLYDSNIEKGEDCDWKLASTQKISYIDPVSGETLTNRNSYGNGIYTSISIIDDTSVVSKKGRRFFRVQARGPAGNSGWQYSDHAFAAPNIPIIDTSAAFIDKADGSGTAVTIPISSESTHLSLVNDNTFKYAIVNPRTTTTTDGTWTRTSLSLPNGFNSWNEGTKFGSTGTMANYSFHTADTVGANEALFVMIEASNSGASTQSNPFMVSTRNGAPLELSAPVLNSVSINTATNSVTVSVNNTTTLENNKSFIAVYFRKTASQEPGKPIGIIPYRASQPQTATFIMPAYDAGDTPSIGIACYVADYSKTSEVSSYPGILTTYEIANEKMASDVVWEDNAVPKPPKITLTRAREGTIEVAWEWTWSDADTAELSWSDDPNAWESTSEPSTYVINRAAFGKSWLISGLSAGEWYVRVRLIRNIEDGVVYGTYSSKESINLSSAPNTPSLYIQPKVIAVDGTLTATWKYSSTDGTGQAAAQLYEATRASDSSPWVYTALDNAYTTSDNSIKFTPETYGWEENTDHYICLSYQSASGFPSEYSVPESNKIRIASLPEISVSGLGGNASAMKLVDIPIGDEGEDTRSDISLTKLPLEFSVTGAGRGGYTTAVITRADGFNLERPDDSLMHGFNGETIIEETIENADNLTAEFSFTLDKLQSSFGHLDDEAPYRLTITVTDTYGQTVTTDLKKIWKKNYNIDRENDIFYVHWEHQAVMPTATVQYDRNSSIAKITVNTPLSGYLDGDYCDIYRLSVDKPQKIVENGILGTTYVDPYPTYGIFSGYRVVYLTKFGDYRMDQTGDLTWTDYGPMEEDQENKIDYLNEFAIRIDFDDESLVLPGNVSLSNSWKKDFQLTKYLGGSMEGDWNPGVERTGSYKTTIPIEHDPEMMYRIRKLADYPGICHVRTPDGSNFYADVTVNDDREAKWVPRLSQVSLSITKVDAVELDGMTLAEWEAEDTE